MAVASGTLLAGARLSIILMNIFSTLSCVLGELVGVGRDSSGEKVLKHMLPPFVLAHGSREKCLAQLEDLTNDFLTREGIVIII